MFQDLGSDECLIDIVYWIIELFFFLEKIEFFLCTNVKAFDFFERLCCCLPSWLSWNLSMIGILFEPSGIMSAVFFFSFDTHRCICDYLYLNCFMVMSEITLLIFCFNFSSLYLFVSKQCPEDSSISWLITVTRISLRSQLANFFYVVSTIKKHSL